IHFLGFAHAGRWLVTASDDQTIRLWDLSTGTELRRFERPEPPKDLGAPAARAMMNGKLVNTGRLVAGLSRRYRVALSGDGKLLAATRGRSAHVWDVASGKLLQSFADEASALPGGLADLAFAADGRTLVTVNGDRTVCVWDLASGKRLRRIEGESPLKAVPGK